MKSSKKVYRLTLIAILSALAALLMFLQLPLPFAPSFMKLDIAELPALFASFYLGPLSGFAVVILKIILKLALKGTSTAFVGEIMNVICGCVYTGIAGYLYQKNHTRKGALLGLCLSTLCVSLVAAALNAVMIFPMYAKMYGMPMDAIIGMVSKVNSLVSDYRTAMIFAVFPFNLIKFAVTSLFTYLMYKRTGNALRELVR